MSSDSEAFWLRELVQRIGCAMKRFGFLVLTIAIVWTAAKVVGFFLANLPRITAAAISALELLGLFVMAVAGLAFALLAAPKIVRRFCKVKSKLTVIHPHGASNATDPSPPRSPGYDRDSLPPTMQNRSEPCHVERSYDGFSQNYLPVVAWGSMTRQAPEVPPATQSYSEPPVREERKEETKQGHPTLILPEESCAPDGSAELPRITIIVEPITTLPAGLDGSTGNRSVQADKVDVLVIGDKTKLRSKVKYRVKELHVDIQNFRRRLSPSAKRALSVLAHNPDDTRARVAFERALLRRKTAEKKTVAQLHTTEGARIDVVRCDILVVGNHNSVSSTTERRIAVGTISLQSLLATQTDLIVQFAQALHDPTKAPDFNHSLSHAVDMMDVIHDSTFKTSGAVRSATWGPCGDVRLGEPIALVSGSETRATTEITARTMRIRPIRELAPIREDLDLSVPDRAKPPESPQRSALRHSTTTLPSHDTDHLNQVSNRTADRTGGISCPGM